MVRSALRDDVTGHDWWHVDRVRATAMAIASAEPSADIYVVELAALLHDISDHKFNGGDDSLGRTRSFAWLVNLGESRELASRVADAVEQVSFRGAGDLTVPGTIETCIVQDADRLDAIGAIGIARAFAYGGHVGQLLHRPEIPPTMHANRQAYVAGRSTTVNHFYEKLLLLADRMNTEAARAIARERHEFMVAYLRQFHLDWGTTTDASVTTAG
jgi:uncharacterized protein